jgi:hypothetical protein
MTGDGRDGARQKGSWLPPPVVGLRRLATLASQEVISHYGANDNVLTDDLAVAKEACSQDEGKVSIFDVQRGKVLGIVQKPRYR